MRLPRLGDPGRRRPAACPPAGNSLCKVGVGPPSSATIRRGPATGHGTRRIRQDLMDGGFQYLDLIFFGVVAVFLVMRLRSVLGRRTGTEQRRDPFAARTKEQPAPVRGPNGALPDLSAKPSIGAPAPATPLAQGLARIRSADPSFDEGRFTAGARTAFEMIVNAFAV